jgi:anti-anti-sigma regulatory factor
MTAGATHDHRMFLVATADEDRHGAPVLTEIPGGQPDSFDLHLFIVGALGEHECDALSAQLLRIAATSRRVSVDLSEVTMLSAAGFGLFLRMHQIVARTGGELRFLAVSPVAGEVLKILGWDEVSQAVIEASVS